jgi:putative DNA primase/helicase
MLRMIRLVVSQETEQGRRWAESRIKALTGGDPVSARFMRQDFFTYTPRFKLLIAGNHKPALRNVDEAIRRRLHLLPFTVTIPRERRDPDLTAKLEAELPGITRWIIEGARRYAEQRLAPPAIVTAATDEYFQDEDLFQQWLEDACERAPGAWEKPTPLYRSWSAYAEAAGERAGSQKAFGARLRTAGFEPGNSRGSDMRGRHWCGLKLRPSPEPEPPEAAW